MSVRSSVGSAAAIVLLVMLSLAGALAYHHQLSVGEVATGLGTLGAGGAVWGLYVVADGFLLGAGVAIMACACLARFSRDREMEAAARIAMPVAITCFLAAALSVLADQGRPAAGLVNLAHYARPQSPFFATFTSVAAVCLFGSLVHCVLARRPDLAEYAKQPSSWQRWQRLLAAGYRGSVPERYRRQQAGIWMSLLMLVLLAVPFGALAIIFTVRPGRSLPIVVVDAIAFTVSSATGGLGLLILAAAWVGRVGGPRAGLGKSGGARLGRGLLVLDALAVLSAVALEIAGLVYGDAASVTCAEAIRRGAYAAMFWSEVGLFFLAATVLWWAARRARLRWPALVVASVMSVAAVCLQRHIGLVAWQTHGLLLPYRPGSYSPSPVEMLVLLGILAFAVLMLLPAVRLIPFAPAAYDERPVTAQWPDRMRTLLTGLWLLAGMVLVVAGLLLALRVWTEPFLDPVVPASPMIFITGLAFLVTAGAVYEILPGRSASSVGGELAREAPPPSPAAER